MRLFALAMLSILAVPGASHAACHAPLPVSSPDADTLAVRVATNVRGDRLVVWKRYLDQYNTTVEATAARAGDAFGTPAMLSDPEPKDGDDRPFITTGLNSDPQVAVAPSGAAIAVSVQNSTDGPPFLDRIRAIVLPPGQTTGERVTVSAETADPSHPGVLFDGAGNATAFWAEQDERVHVAVRPASGSFRAPDAISNPASTIETPAYAVAANGDAAVVWSSYGRIVAAVRSSGGASGRASSWARPRHRPARRRWRWTPKATPLPCGSNVRTTTRTARSKWPSGPPVAALVSRGAWPRCSIRSPTRPRSR
jgi:hypothetical protein